MLPTLTITQFQGRTLRIARLTHDESAPLPLFIMMDGQNLFDDKTASYGKSWGIIDQWNTHQLPNVLIVGIDNAPGMKRLDEYSPYVNSTIVGEYDWITRPVGGEGHHFLQWITEHLIPHLYETIPHLQPLPAAIGGSSMGGLISLYGLLAFPTYFNKAACVSNAFWFATDEIEDFIRKQPLDHIKKLYLDVGTAEVGLKDKHAYLISHERIINALLQRSFHHFDYHLFGGQVHNESAWEKRIPLILNSLFK